MARIVTVTSGKGGVGKTNISVGLALQLASLGHRTCLFDADLGLANVNIILGLYPEHTLEDVLFNGKTIDDIVIRKYDGMDIIPGSSGIKKLAHLDFDRLKMVFEQFSIFDHYDFFIFDTSAGVSENVISFCKASSEIVLVITPEPTSLTDGYGLLKVLSMNGFEGKVMVVVNESKDAKTANMAYTKLKNTVQKHLPIETVPLGLVFHDDYVAEAVKEQTPFITRYPHSNASKCIRKISKRLVKKEIGDAGEPSFESFWTNFVDFYKVPLRLPHPSKGNGSAGSDNPVDAQGHQQTNKPSEVHTETTVEAMPPAEKPDHSADAGGIASMAKNNHALLTKLSEAVSSLAKDMTTIKQVLENGNRLNTQGGGSFSPGAEGEATTVKAVETKKPAEKPKEDPPKVTSKDQRKHPRAACEIPVGYATEEGAFDGFIKDISRCGLFIETRAEIDVGESINMTFCSPRQNKTVKIAGRVIRKNNLGVGVEFKKAKTVVDQNSWIDCRRVETNFDEERRTNPRVDLHCPVFVGDIRDQKTVTDLSTGGVFVECDPATRNRYRVGRPVKLSIKLPTEDDFISVPARVTNHNDRGMHCQFGQMDRRAEDAIYYCFNMAKHTIPIK